MKVDINKQKRYDFDDFIEDYTVIRKEYLKVEFSPSNIVIILTSIFFAFLFFFQTVFFDKHAQGLVSLGISIGMVILLCIYYNLPCVKTGLRQKYKKGKRIKYDKLKQLLKKLNKNYQDKDEFDRFIKYCRDKREQINLKNPIEQFAEEKIVSSILVPIFVSEITASVTLKAGLNSYLVIIAITFLVIMIAFSLYCLLSAFFHRKRDVYDSLINDLEELSEMG